MNSASCLTVEQLEERQEWLRGRPKHQTLPQQLQDVRFVTLASVTFHSPAQRCESSVQTFDA